MNKKTKRKISGKNIVTGVLIFFAIAGVLNIIFPEDKIDKPNTSNEVVVKDDPTSYQLGMIVATSQIAIENYGFNDDTSFSIDDWTINRMLYDGDYRWTAVTNSKNLGRVKVIWDWSGNDKDDLILVYLLINGEELVNDLRK